MVPNEQSRMENIKLLSPLMNEKEEVPSSLLITLDRGRRVLTQFSYQAYTLWLFNFSDLKTIVFPQTFFGILASLSGPICLLSPAPPSISHTLSRIPLVLLYVWINLLPFAIDNQRHQFSILEDGLNKPWRPLPSKRCTSSEARAMMLIIYPLALSLSYFTGGLKQSAGLVLFGYWYNDLGGANNGFLVRNFINGCGYICFAWGALNTASYQSSTPILTTQAFRWLFILGAVIFSTVSMQDLFDQAGDKMCGRQTMPLVLGDVFSRWLLSILLAYWSFWCPWYWNLSYSWYIPTTIIGAVIIFRILSKHSIEEDKLSFRVWNLWVVLLYLFPLAKRFESI